MAAHEAPLSLGFSRQEHWSGLLLVAQLCPTLCDPVDCSPPGSSVHGAFQARILEWVAISFSKGSSLPRDRTRTPTLQTDTLTSEPPGKPTWKVDVLNYVLSLGQIPGTPSPWSLPLGQACPMLKETAGPSTGQRAKNSWPLCPAGSPLWAFLGNVSLNS